MAAAGRFRSATAPSTFLLRAPRKWRRFLRLPWLPLVSRQCRPSGRATARLSTCVTRITNVAGRTSVGEHAASEMMMRPAPGGPDQLAQLWASPSAACQDHDRTDPMILATVYSDRPDPRLDDTLCAVAIGITCDDVVVDDDASDQSRSVGLSASRPAPRQRRVRRTDGCRVLGSRDRAPQDTGSAARDG